MTESSHTKSSATFLRGKRILVTRPINQTRDFVDQLHAAGAEAIIFPTVEICDPISWELTDEAILQIAEYEGLIFTSANAVRFFFDRATSLDISQMNVLSGKLICVVGSKTQATLRFYGCNALVVPERFTSKELLTLLRNKDLKGKRFLHPRGDLGSSVIKIGLEKLGAHVHEIIVYRTLTASPENVSQVKSEILQKKIDVVAFFSPSSVEGFVDILMKQSDKGHYIDAALKNVAIAVIGPVTAEAVRKAGFTPSIFADESTAESLVNSIDKYYSMMPL